jgi:hypothetical protein
MSLSEKINGKFEFSWGVLVQQSCHPRNSTWRPFFRKTNTVVVFRRSENLRIQNFTAKLQPTRPHAPPSVANAPFLLFTRLSKKEDETRDVPHHLTLLRQRHVSH